SANNIAGALSHPEILPAAPVKYIGPLSRFEKIPVEKKYDLLIILSGPEPQRTIFETLLIKELKTFNGTGLLVRGLPGNTETDALVFNDENKIPVYNHLTAAELNKAIQQADMVISRSGYTTVMDLVKLQQKAILVATPGQTEQEYVAEYLMKQNMFFSVAQKDFSLSEALQKSAGFYFTTLPVLQDQYKNVIKEFTQHLR
ncbi:MAG: glycosyltransferase, partial [Ferruginibacter sp.]